MMDREATITRYSQTGAKDRGGNPTVVAAPTVETACYIEQTEAVEVTVGRETHISRHLGVFPSGVGLDASDEVELDGETYRVLGPPWKVWEPGAGESQVEARLQVVT